MDFEKICMMFTMQEPYYGILLSSMVRTPVPAHVCSTMGVARSGNVFKLGYNPDFVNRLDIDTLFIVLKHEILHVAFNQLTMWDEEPKSKQEAYLRNVAMDLEVNSYLPVEKMRGISPMTADKFGWEKKAGAREYMRRLLNEVKKQQQKKVSIYDGLNKLEKRIVKANKIKKKSVAEIAGKLNISEDKVRAILKRARKKIRTNLNRNNVS